MKDNRPLTDDEFFQSLEKARQDYDQILSLKDLLSEEDSFFLEKNKYRNMSYPLGLIIKD